VSNFPFPVSADARISLFLSLILGSAAFLSSFFSYLSLRRAIGPVMLRRAGGTDAADQPSLPAAAACALPHKADCRA
jgi:hypothetical protein